MQRVTATFLLASLALVAGCESGSSTGPKPIDFAPPPAPSGQGFVALYAPPVDVGPYPNDIYNLPGQPLSVPDKITSPLAAALNTLDGFSTTAEISAPFNAPIDPATLVPFNPLAPPSGAESVFVLDATNGVPLVPGLHYELRLSTAAGTGGSILEFEPLRPLAPDTTYAFILTSGIRNTAGVAAAADTVFGLVRDAHLAGVMTGNPGLDALLPAIGPLIDAGGGLLGLPGDAIISAWSVSTQSISDVLDEIEQAATARAHALVFAGVTTADLGLGLPGIADVYAGFIEIPYFGDPTDPLGSFWVNAGLAPPTRLDPVAVPRVPSLRIPMIATVPNAFSGQPKPSEGWPVVIYQHAVTRSRTDLFAIADSFAGAGFAVVAIDLPLHGVRDATNPFYQGPGSAFGDNERHFGADNVDGAGLPIPDGLIDDGRQIFNISNPLNARDHMRQANSDLIYLTRTIPVIDFDGEAGPDFDPARIHFASVSLGSIISTVFLGVSSEVTTATLSNPAGPWGDLLSDPESITFAAPVRAALAAQGLAQGTAAFDNFGRDLQTIMDPADPVNYAAAASASHPIHALEVLGDITVPNGPTDYIATLMGLADVSATTVDAGGVRGIVRFNSGSHTSLLDPSADPAVTIEMQTQMVTFAASNGTTILVTDTTVVD